MKKYKFSILTVIVTALVSQFSFADDKKRLLSYVYNGIEYSYLLSLGKAELLPQWQIRDSDIPLGIEEAILIAEDSIKEKYSEIQFLHYLGAEFLRLGLIGTKKDIWVYKVSFAPQINDIWDYETPIIVIVLFDGTVLFHE